MVGRTGFKEEQSAQLLHPTLCTNLLRISRNTSSIMGENLDALAFGFQVSLPAVDLSMTDGSARSQWVCAVWQVHFQGLPTGEVGMLGYAR
jgi:hypothetical protein